jgi:hypothetical protein
LLQTGHGLRQHEGQSIFARAPRAGEDKCGRHARPRDRFPQVPDRRFISYKLIEAHITRLAKKQQVPIAANNFHPQQRRHPERSATQTYRITDGLRRGVEGPRRCLLADALQSFQPALQVTAAREQTSWDIWGGV